MANFISKLFQKTPQLDEAKLALQAQISVQNAVLDKHLVALAVQQNRLQAIESLISLTTVMDENNIRTLHDEINLLNEYVCAYKALKGENFFITLQNNVDESSDYKIFPFVLIPLVQNAIVNGYTTMEKYPIRIKLNSIGDTFKIEVSNRVNHYIANQEDTALIDNFKARLELIYPNKHSLIINSNSAIFKATVLLK
jgi:LytS/YehU family sensor histidine kinase